MLNKKKKLLPYAIGALGISSVITQIVLIREFLSVFYGNELVLGIILANWLLLTGIGAYIGKYAYKVREKLRIIIICQAVTAFIPFLEILLIRALKNLLFPIGSLVSIAGVFTVSLVLLMPYCLLSGALFTLFCSALSTRAEAIGRVYSLDSTGSIIGGLIFSFVFAYLLNPFQTAFFIILINLLAALLLSNMIKNRALRNTLALLILLSFTLLIVNFNKISIGLQYPHQELVYNKNSPYGNLVITRNQDQLNFFENGMPLFSSEDTVKNEETVHYAMVQHPNPKTVLLVGGGISGTTEEALKYPIDRVDYVELDPTLIQAGKVYTRYLEDAKVKTITQDARLFIKESQEKYDVVIIDLPDPTTAQINRYYTQEFFNELKERMNPNGVVSLSLTSTQDYLSKEAIQLHSVLYNTLLTVFQNVIIIPGTRNFFLASDSPLSYDIARKIKEKNIQTRYVNEDYLKGEVTQERIDYLLNTITKEKNTANRDFHPIAYYYHLLYWLDYFKTNYLLLIGTVILAGVLFTIRLKPLTFSIFTIGFSASTLEIVLLILFQILYGYVYQLIGLIITVFMLGLAIGSFYSTKHLRKDSEFLKIQFIIAVYSVLLPFTLMYLSKVKMNPWMFEGIFSLLTLIIAILVGMEFPLASRLDFKNSSETAAKMYHSDMIGAAFGALLASALLIPLLGIVNVALICGALNFISICVLRIRIG